MVEALVSNKRKLKITTLDLKLIFIILFAIGFIFSIFFIIKNRLFLTRYVQLFLADFESYILNSERGQLNGFVDYFPMLNGFYTLFYNITALEPIKILIFPFGFILFPVSIYFFIRSFNKDFDKVALMGALYFFVYYFYSKYLQAGYVASLAIPIVLMFTAHMVRIFKKKNIIQNLILAILELGYLIGIWHSAAFYVIALIGGFALVYLIASLSRVIIKRKRKDNIDEIDGFLKPKISLYLIVTIVLVGSLVLNVKRDLLLSYLELFENRFLNGNFVENIKNIFVPLISRLFGKSDYPLTEGIFEYNYTSTISGKVYFSIHLLLHLFSAFLLLIGLIVMIRRIRKNKENDLLIWIIFGFSLIVAQIVFYVLYSATSANLFFIAIIFPIVGIYFARKIGWKKLSAISMGIFLGFATIMSISSIASNQFGYNTGSTYEDNVYGFEWLANNSNPNLIVMLDFNLHGRYLQYSVRNNVSLNYIVYYIDSANYSFLTGIENPPQKYNSSWYFVFDIKTMNSRIAFDIYEKRGLLISRLDLININPNFALVYNDGIVAIYNYRSI